MDSSAEGIGSLVCYICKSSVISKCGGCGLVGYCSKAHQKSHWPIHKSECKAWKLSESVELGRFLVAARNIKAGEIILQEEPILTSPPRITLPVCLNCYTEFEDDSTSEGDFSKAHACQKNCGFPMCERCKDGMEVHQPECTAAWMRGGVKIRNYENPHPTYEAIGILRMLDLREKNPAAYDKLKSLKSHDTNSSSGKGEGEENEELKASALRTVNLVQDFFRKDLSKQELLQLLSILDTNGHEIPIPNSSGQITRRFVGLYYTSSFLEHNCIPNCTKTFSKGPTAKYEIQIRGAVAIKRGEHLSISYVDPMWGTADRHHFLRLSKHFECRCRRCLDPTELSTYSSSVRCQHGSCLSLNSSGVKGLISPTDPFDHLDNLWKCNACSETYSANYVISIVDKVGKVLEELHHVYGNIEAEEEFLKKYSKILSPHHYYLLEIKLGLAQIYGRHQEEPLPLLPPNKLRRKEQLCTELLEVFNIISPGLNRLRSLILYELQAAVVAFSKMRRAVEEISLNRHLEELTVSGIWLKEAVKVLGWEHEDSVEKRRAEGGEHELEELKILLLQRE